MEFEFSTSKLEERVIPKFEIVTFNTTIIIQGLSIINLKRIYIYIYSYYRKNRNKEKRKNCVGNKKRREWGKARFQKERTVLEFVKKCLISLVFCSNQTQFSICNF